MDVVRLSKQLSYVLRHRPDSVGLTLDPDGWVAIPDLLRALKISRADLERAVATSDKQQFGIDGDRIRAESGPIY